MATKPQEVATIVDGEAPTDFLTALVLNPNVDAAKLETVARVWTEMQERQRAWLREDAAEKARVAYFADMAVAQAKFPVVEKATYNPHTKSNYADQGAIWEQCRSIWTDAGFSATYPHANLNEHGLIAVTLRIGHKDGHFEIFTAPPAPPDTAGAFGKVNKTSLQGNQATITYLMRGLLCRGFGIAVKGEDKDGNLSRGDEEEGGENRDRQQQREPAGPDPKIVKWMDDVLTLFSQLQSEGGHKNLWAKINPQYKTVRDLWPAMAEKIDAASAAALKRVREAVGDVAKEDDGWPGPDVPTKARTQ
jgi:hypothetical protein